MIQKLKYVLVTLFLVGIGFIGSSGTAKAQVMTLTYPIAELGYCRDAKECSFYCDIEENKPACWSYGKFVLNRNVLAVETTSNVTFPVTELGNCASALECKAYCDIAAYKIACTNFAKNHVLGHYKDDQTKLDAAKQELGCSTYDSCRALCETPDGKVRCQAFAAKYVSKEVKAKQDELLTRAKAILGCTTYEECRQFCQNPVNHEVCAKFSKSTSQSTNTNIQSIQQKLGCTTEGQCREICQANPEKCPGFKITPKATTPIYSPTPRADTITNPY